MSNETDLKETLREKLADYAHDAWSRWMTHLFSKCQINRDGTLTIPKSSVDRWTMQMDTAYADLPEDMKKSDRDEADKMMAIMDLLRKISGVPSSYLGVPEGDAGA